MAVLEGHGPELSPTLCTTGSLLQALALENTGEVKTPATTLTRHSPLPLNCQLCPCPLCLQCHLLSPQPAPVSLLASSPAPSQELALLPTQFKCSCSRNAGVTASTGDCRASGSAHCHPPAVQLSPGSCTCHQGPPPCSSSSPTPSPRSHPTLLGCSRVPASPGHSSHPLQSKANQNTSRHFNPCYKLREKLTESAFPSFLSSHRIGELADGGS